MRQYQKEILEMFKKMDNKKFMLIPRCRGKKYIHTQQNEAIKQIEKLHGTNPIGIIIDEMPNISNFPTPIIKSGEIFTYSTPLNETVTTESKEEPDEI